MYRIFNDQGVLLYELDFELEIKGDFIQNRSHIVNTLRRFGIDSEFLKIRTKTINSSNFKDLLGKFRNGKWIGNGDLYSYYEKDNQIIFSLEWNDFYIKGFIIEDDLLEMEFVCDYKLSEGLSDGLKFIHRENRLNELGLHE